MLENALIEILGPPSDRDTVCLKPRGHRSKHDIRGRELSKQPRSAMVSHARLPDLADAIQVSFDIDGNVGYPFTTARVHGHRFPQELQRRMKLAAEASAARSQYA